MHKPFSAVLLLMLLCQSCSPSFPKVAQDLATSAICDFPPFSGNNMCKEVEISHIVFEEMPDIRTTRNGNMGRWCLELKYLDFTGEWGFACIWLEGPDSQGEYSIQRGPNFDNHCP